jgi:ABC-type uncharacterized transport system substrate-binding protein
VKHKKVVKMEEIQLAQTKLNTMKEHFQHWTDPGRKAKYEKAINELGNKLDDLLAFIVFVFNFNV